MCGPSGSALPPPVSTDGQSMPNRVQSNQTAIRRQPSLGAASSRNNEIVVTSSLLMDCESGASPMAGVAWSANARLVGQDSGVVVEQPSVTSRPVNPFQGGSSASTSSVTSPSPAALARFSGLPLQTRPKFSSSTGRTAFPFDVAQSYSSG